MHTLFAVLNPTLLLFYHINHIQLCSQDQKRSLGCKKLSRPFRCPGARTEKVLTKSTSNAFTQAKVPAALGGLSSSNSEIIFIL